MPPPSNHPSLDLQVADPPYFVTKLQPTTPIPRAFLDAIAEDSGRFLSITRTSEEISIVGEVHETLPAPTEDSNWKLFKLRGPLDFGLTGILSSFVDPLKAASISVFAISTYDTDYILVPGGDIAAAVEVLKQDGWSFVN